jgi:hypothetical protein
MAPRALALRTDHPLFPWLLGLFGLALAALGARPYAGSWNDGSRLATVEALADHHSFAIDNSVFCHAPTDTIARGCPPYPAEHTDLLENGTRDKLLIDGHFYSDKPGVISLLMAGAYQGARLVGLPTAAERPDLFCFFLTVATSGLAYAVSLLCLHRLGRLLALPPATHLLWLGSFALSTFALAYTRHVNNHILLLAVLLLCCVQLVELARDTAAGRSCWGRLMVLGALAGIGFNLDLGSGPLLAAGLFLAVAYRCRRPAPVLVFALAAAPWAVAWEAINYTIGGVWKPMNMVPEYSAWPGCPFNPSNMTGYARHGPFRFVVYCLALMFGKKGVLVHNLPLLLALPAMFRLLRRPALHRPELLFAVGWSAASWLIYAALSNNYGGACTSVRWFVPLLGPGYFLLACHLRDRPQALRELLALSLWGAVLAALMWWRGPWADRMVPLLWPIVGSALLSWLWCARRARAVAPATLPFPLASAQRQTRSA